MGTKQECYELFFKILVATAHKITTIRPLTFHLTKDPSKKNKSCGSLLEKQRRANELRSSMDPYTSTSQCLPPRCRLEVCREGWMIGMDREGESQGNSRSQPNFSNYFYLIIIVNLHTIIWFLVHGLRKETVSVIIKLATLVEGDPKVSFSIATKSWRRGGRYSIPRIAPLYPWSLSKAASSGIFESLVWLDLGLNPDLLDHWRTHYSFGQLR